MCRLEKRKVRFQVSIHNHSQRRLEIFFPSRQCGRLEESWSYLPDVKPLANLPFCELSSGFYSLLRTFRRSFHCRVLKKINVFWYFAYHVTPFCVNTWQFFHRNFIYTHRHFFPSSSLQLPTFTFSLHSSWVWNETMVHFTNHFLLQSTSHLPFAITAIVFSTHPTSFRIFRWIPYWYPLKFKNGFPFLV
jgi:hypothetical protein